MKMAILGTGGVGQTIGTALIKAGHQVALGSRTAGNAKGLAWAEANGVNASTSTFKAAAEDADLIFFCVNGDKAMEVIHATGAAPLAGKIVVDLTNPLDFSKGFPPSLLAAYREQSLAETIQAAIPEAQVVKALNTLTAKLMVEPGLVNHGDHDLFICGRDQQAKTTVVNLLHQAFGWKTGNIHDLGDLSAARATEAYVTFWARVMQANGSPMFNIKVVR